MARGLPEHRDGGGASAPATRIRLPRTRDRSRRLVLALLAGLVLLQILTVGAVIVSQQVETNHALDIHTEKLLQDVVDTTR